MSYTRKPKRPKSICLSAFPEQFARLRPERTAAGGIKSRSQSEAVRMAVYRGIASMFAMAHPYCDACRRINSVDANFMTQPHHRDHTHHIRGRDGLLLFDVRYFLSVCEAAHRWIDANREAAMKLGLLAKKGDWNKLV